jgi:hypothetical protein
MQRLKKALRHLRTIQHVALLLVVGPANNTAPVASCTQGRERRFSGLREAYPPMGKAIAIFFGFSALIIVAGSFAAPSTVSASKHGCSPAYGVDPCTTASVK